MCCVKFSLLSGLRWFVECDVFSSDLDEIAYGFGGCWYCLILVVLIFMYCYVITLWDL